MIGAPSLALRSPRRAYLLLLSASLAALGLSLTVGPGELSDVELRSALLSLRASRSAAAFLAGSSLAVAGVLVQGLFRNPLASPSIIGTTAGANLGGRLALLLFALTAVEARPDWMSPLLLVPLGSMMGATVALLLLFLFSRVRDDIVVLLLTGFLLSSLFLALGGLVISLAQARWELSRAIIGFTLGDISGVDGGQLALALPLTTIGILAAWNWSGSLDLMLTGEEEAQSLGLRSSSLRRWVVIWTAILTASAVSVGGNLSFVGLVVPHALRPLFGVRHAHLILSSALGGGVFVMLCDVVCRASPGRSEIPLGVVTGLVGAPCFLWLLVRYRRQVRGH